jgi:hypothetical protein
MAARAIEDGLAKLFDKARIAATGTVRDDGWSDITAADVMARSIIGTNSIVSQHRPQAESQQILDVLPLVDTIARPEFLFAATIPYHMMVSQQQRGVLIESSHEPSLQVLADYFKKWTRKMVNTSNVCIKIQCLLVRVIV